VQFIQFDHSLSRLESFDTIGYDVETETLTVKFFDGSERTFYHVPEKKVFHFLLTEDKENYYHQNIQSLNGKEGR
jgi:hypothetical protein